MSLGPLILITWAVVAALIGAVICFAARLSGRDSLTEQHMQDRLHFQEKDEQP